MREDEDDFPLHDDLSNLLDVMDQIPVEDVDGEGRRIVSNPALAAPVSPVSRTKAGSKSRKKEVAVTDDDVDDEVIAEAAPKPAPVVRDTSEDRITPKRLEAIAGEIFGTERVDVHISSSSRYSLYVLFPDFVITNSDGNTHRIRELYVSFTIEDQGGRFTVEIKGTRGTLTVSEANTNYAHSHLPLGASQGVFHNFCQGSSVFKTITTGLVVRPTEAQWELALLSLENYVKWESLEGGPHALFSSITSGSSRNNINYLAELKRWVSEVPTDAFDMGSAGLTLNPSGKLRKFYDQASMIRSTQGSGTRSVETWQSEYDRNYQMSFRFKTREVKVKIIPDDNATSSTFIEESVVEQYNAILQSNLTNFNKRIDYEYLRFRNRARIGQSDSIQQADINYYKATTGKDRIAARSRRKQGVVGRVNNLRKREDNRFG